MGAPADEAPRAARRWLLRGARNRIVAAFIVLLAFSTLLSLLAIQQLLVVRADNRVSARLVREVEEFRRVTQGRNPETGEPWGTNLEGIFEQYFRRNVRRHGTMSLAFLDGQLFDSSGRIGGGAPTSAQLGRWARVTRSETGELEMGSDTVRYRAVPVRGRRGVRGAFVVAASLTFERDEANDAVRLAAVVLVSVLFIASALAWVVAGRVLAPLRLLRDTTHSIGETDLTRRIQVSGDDELADLARSFNAMLDRLEAAFASQRAFVSDASHELRTPIAIIRGHLELLGDDPEQRRETVAVATDELDRMTRFVDDLLLLARAERRDFLHAAEVELGPLLDKLLEKARALGSRDWRADARCDATVVADPQRLTQAIMGLAHNAVSHTEEGDPIWIGVAADEREARLWVRDCGPGIPYADQQRIFERFARAGDGPRRSNGVGLGLAIVRAIAEAHGGRVELHSRPGHGATFIVTVPLEARQPRFTTPEAFTDRGDGLGSVQ